MKKNKIIITDIIGKIKKFTITCQKKDDYNI